MRRFRGFPVRFAFLSGRGGVRLSPPGTLALLYFSIVLCGALLLKLPISTYDPIRWSDAAFTSASAVTVTGLVVVDTGTDFTLFGQAVILALIQLGGLGLMTFAVMVLSMIGLPMSLPQQMYLKEDLNQTSLGGVVRLAGVILRVVLVCELIGTALLAFVFVPEYGWGAGLWQSLFHAVSAFNNAGFSLHADSMTQWVSNPIINLTIPGLLIIGGLGFSVLSDIGRNRSWARLTVHSKLMLAGSLVLLIGSAVLIGALEWDNPATLGNLDAQSKLSASWFQAAMTRTAGFNSVDISGLHDSTSFLVICLMLIGGGSTSTAGGMKVTTFVILLLATLAFFRRQKNVYVFGKAIGQEDLMKVLAVTVLMVIITSTSLFLISISHDGDFLDLAFEVSSAMGTVGLSRGATGDLDLFGRVVIMFVMFLGRVGPLSLGFFLATRVPPRVRYPEGRILIG